MSQLQVDTILNTNGDGAPDFPNGMTVTGVVTATTLNQNVTGIITASSLDIGGVVTATSFTGDGSNLTGTPGPTLSFVADGALAAGKPVIVNSTGKAKAIIGVDGVLGVATTFSPDNRPANVGCCQISETKFVVVYRRTNDQGYVVIATITNVGNSVITYGTPVNFSGVNGACSVIYDDNADRIVIGYKDSATNHGTYIVGTVSGTSISLGTKAVYMNSSYYPDLAYDSVNNKVVFVGGNSTTSKLIVGTVDPSNNTISLGSASANYCTNPTWTSIDYHPGTGKFILSYKDDADSNKSKAIPVTITGTDVSFGTAGEFSPHNTPETDVNAIDATRFVMVGSTGGANNATMSKVGTISGTTITFGNNSYINDADGNYITQTKQPIVSFNYNDPANTLKCWFDKSSDNRVWSSNGKINDSGGITWEVPTLNYKADNTTPRTWAAGQNFGELAHIVTRSGTARNFIAYRGHADAYGFAMVDTYIETNVTVGNYIGFSQAAYSDGQTSTISVVGSKIGNQTGLTTGTQYYVLPDATLGTTASTPSIVAGNAISSTELLIK
tara:strand:+ start:1390 stop:3057 length:1668 start_codon:yes stop_codon:yes gene_type:complete